VEWPLGGEYRPNWPSANPPTQLTVRCVPKIRNWVCILALILGSGCTNPGATPAGIGTQTVGVSRCAPSELMRKGIAAGEDGLRGLLANDAQTVIKQGNPLVTAGDTLHRVNAGLPRISTAWHVRLESAAITFQQLGLLFQSGTTAQQISQQSLATTRTNA
jgi:hypothetical protein